MSQREVASSLLPLWEKVDAVQSIADGLMGLFPGIETPHPALRATFSHKGRRKKGYASRDYYFAAGLRSTG